MLFDQFRRLEGCGALHQTAIDVDALAKAHAAHQRRQYRLAGVHAAHHIDDDHAQSLRFALAVAVNRHQTGKRLNHQISGGQAVVGTLLTEAGDRQIDRLGIDLLDTRIIETEFFHHARTK